MPGWQSIVPPVDEPHESRAPRDPVPVMATPEQINEAPAESKTVAVDQVPADVPGPSHPTAAPTHAWTAAEQPYDRLDCPACGTIFQELPEAIAGCPSCRATIHVLTCPEGIRHLLTAADVEAFDDDWDALHVRRKREEAQRRNAVALQARRATLASYAELGVRLVELRTATGACAACVAAAAKPYRPRAAPALPIKGCRHDICRCLYAPARPKPSRPRPKPARR
jgi:hypothetical protein